ncbi:MAG: TatD family hydrolase [Steroidobacteraceae bacterium]
MSGPQYIDIGINLAHDSFDADREAVLRRALAAGVVQMVVTGASVEGTRAAIELARAVPAMLSATAGCHPHHAAELSAAAASELEELARRPEVVAVGECGLDYHRNFSPPAAQREAFHRQLEIAARVGKPLFLHQRDAHADFVAILREHADRIGPGVAHCFTGERAELLEYLDMGLSIGITGWICDERRGLHLRELMPLVPAGRLMIETDEALPAAARPAAQAGLASQRAELPAAHRRDHRGGAPTAGGTRTSHHGSRAGPSLAWKSDDI